jgi:hypothetical protein
MNRGKPKDKKCKNGKLNVHRSLRKEILEEFQDGG